MSTKLLLAGDAAGPVCAGVGGWWMTTKATPMEARCGSFDVLLRERLNRRILVAVLLAVNGPWIDGRPVARLDLSLLVDVRTIDVAGGGGHLVAQYARDAGLVDRLLEMAQAADLTSVVVPSEHHIGIHPDPTNLWRPA